MNFGIGEVFVILILGLVLFGAKRLPETGRALGRAIKEFKKGLTIEENHILESIDEESE